MSWRRLPPVASPLSAAAVGAGAGAALISGRARRARLEVEDWLQATYAPKTWRWTDSGTSALSLALRLASQDGLKTVALPAYGCFDLATACDAAGVRVALYDVDPGTLGPDWTSLEQALRAGAGVVVAVHLYGLPVDLDRLTELAQRNGAVIVEDAAQGIGGSWRGRPLGAHGALSVLSFGRGKGNTSGGGGALLVHDTQFADRLPELPHGGAGVTAVAKTGVQYLLARPQLYVIPASLPFLGLGETRYRSPAPATGMPSSGFGVLSRSMLEVDWSTEARRATAAAYRAAVGPEARPMAPYGDRGVAGYLRFPLILGGTEGLPSEAATLGILPAYPAALADLPGFGTKVAGSVDVPGARLLARQLVTLPTQWQVSPHDIQRILACVRLPSEAPTSR